MIDLSEVLLPGRTAKDGLSLVPPQWASDNIENLSDLLSVPGEKVKITDESRIVFHTDPRSPGADRFRLLRMRFREMRQLTGMRSLIITSPLPEDGKSTVTLNLATALAEGGERTVLVIEADFHRPALTQTLGLPTRPGFAECLQNGLDPISCLHRIEPLNWYLLQAGTSPGNPAELLQKMALDNVMKTLSVSFDWILVDTPPVVPLTDALYLAPHVDSCLLVTRANRTPKKAIKDALGLLGPKHVAGIVLNGAEGLNREYRQYSQYYRPDKK